MGVKKQAAFSTIEVGDAISGISKLAAFPGYHERMYEVCVCVCVSQTCPPHHIRYNGWLTAYQPTILWIFHE